MASSTFKLILALLLFIVHSTPVLAQVSVALAPSVHQQFLTSTGAPLAGGFVYTYAAGSTTPQTTYTDETGTIANANPIPLDATGAPSNGSTQTGIWLSNTSYKICAYNSALVLQWCTDQVNAYQVLNNINQIIFGGVTSDPSAVAGEVWYRSDLPCLRLFTTFADCVVTQTATQTLTNKTLTSPIVNGTVSGTANYVTPTVNSVQIVNSPGSYFSISNAGGVGTVLNTLTKLSSAPSVALQTLTTDTQGVVGITVSGAGNTGTATIQQSGTVSCAFDGATTSGDYVDISSLTAGDCHDFGTGTPASGTQLVGVVLSTNAGTGTYLIDLYSPGIVGQPVPIVVTPVNTTGLSSNTSAVILASISANGFYRLSCYVVLTQAATASSTLPACNVIYNDGDTGVSESLQLTNTDSTNILGAVGRISGTLSVTGFYAQSPSSIQYSTTGYASTGATPMKYSVRIRLEGPF